MGSLLKMKGTVCKYLPWTECPDLFFIYLLETDRYAAEPIKALEPTAALLVAISKG